MPRLNQHIPQSILNGLPLLNNFYISISTWACESWDDSHLAMKGVGDRLIRVQYNFAKYALAISISLFSIVFILCLFTAKCGEILKRE